METLAQNIVYMMATKQSMSLEGNEWEQIFAECVGAEWKPSNVGLDDVVWTIVAGVRKLSLDKLILNIKIRLD